MRGEDGEAPSASGPGLLFVNDVDVKTTCQTLASRIRKTRSTHCVVTLIDSKFWPVPPKPVMQFDKVLCDAPCSGDGTLRKNPELWERWTVKSMTAMHCTQKAILMRGLAALKPGGRLVYSTCSFNPIENEAVVLSALQWANDAISLVAAPPLDGLRVTAGLSTWRVPDLRDTSGHTSFGAWSEVPPDMTKRLRVEPSMFPTGPRLEELRKCVRILPHHNDSGGFFVCIFEKHGQVTLPPGPEQQDPVPPEATDVDEEAESSGAEDGVEVDESGYNSDGRLQFKHMVLEPLSASHPLWLELESYYGLFTSADHGMKSDCLVETQGGKQGCRITLTEAPIVQFLAELPNYTRLRVVNFGLRCFKKLHHGFLKDAICRWYPCKDAAHILWRCMSRRKITADLAIMRQLLLSKEIPIVEMGELEDQGKLSGLETCKGEDEKWITGGLLLGLGSGGGEVVCIPCMLTNRCVQLNADKEDIRATKTQLGIEEEPKRADRPRRGDGFTEVLTQPAAAGSQKN